jgi:hypothetical protein
VSFARIKNHFSSNYAFETKLFTVNSRSDTIQKLYEAAAKTPVPTIEQLDKILGIRGRRSSDSFVCTPVLGQLRRRIKKNDNMEIETRVVIIFVILFIRSVNCSSFYVTQNLYLFL